MSVVHSVKEEAGRLQAVRTRLARQFADLPEGALDEEIERSLARFQGVRIRDYVPMFVERDVRQRLRGRPAR